MFCFIIICDCLLTLLFQFKSERRGEEEQESKLAEVGLSGGGAARKPKSSRKQSKEEEKEKEKEEKSKNKKHSKRDEVGAEDSEEDEEELAVLALMRSNFDALANFTPSVVTDANGKAYITVKVPHNLTRYRYPHS